MYAPVLFWIFAALLVCVSASNEKKIVCYYNSSSSDRPGKGHFEISNIDPTLCTHLVYSHAKFSFDGEIESLVSDGISFGYNEFNSLRAKSNEIKTFIAMGSDAESSRIYSAVASDPRIRSVFIDNAIKFMENYDFDGMSFDWQYPNQDGKTPEDRENYVKLLKELREEFDKAGFLLMATVSVTPGSYDIPEMVKYLDTINLMTFDYHDYSEGKTGLNAPLFLMNATDGRNVHESVKYWIEQGAPSRKLVLGIPAYGRSFTLKDPKDHGVRAAATGPGKAGPYTQEPGFLGHNEIMEILPEYKKGYDIKQWASYAFKDDQWLSYEDETSSIDEKLAYAKVKELGGVMLYTIDTDDFLGFSGVKYPLLKGLNREVPIPTTSEPPSTSPTAATSEITTSDTTTTTQAPTTTPSSSSFLAASFTLFLIVQCFSFIL